MAFIRGYVSLPTTSYPAWRSSVSGNGYDADLRYGDQCWDLCAEFWHNLGYPNGYPITQQGGGGQAWMCWTYSRDINKGDDFDLIYDISDVKQGDVIVWDGTLTFPTGHIGFADEDYDVSGYIHVLGQNQGTGGVPPPIDNPDGGTTANVKRLSVSNFLGAFRYKGWGGGPTPPTIVKKSHFPWVLYANKLRKRNGM